MSMMVCMREIRLGSCCGCCLIICGEGWEVSMRVCMREVRLGSCCGCWLLVCVGRVGDEYEGVHA